MNLPIRIPAAALLAAISLAVPASAAPFPVGSGGLDWKQTSVYKVPANPAPNQANDRTMFGYFTRQSAGVDGRPSGTVSTEAPATGGPIGPFPTPTEATYTFSFPAKATGTYDPATKTGQIDFDGQIKFLTPVPNPSMGPTSRATIDDPSLVFDGTNSAKLYAEGVDSDGTAYDRTQPIFVLELGTQTQTGGTVTFKDAYPRVGGKQVFTFGFPASEADRTPATFGRMDITVRSKPPTVEAAPATGLSTAGQDVTVSGTGATLAGPGLYVYLSPAGTAPGDANATGPARFVPVATFGAGGSFTTVLRASSPFTTPGGSVDCLLVSCVIRTAAAHGNFNTDRSQDTATPVTFSAPAATESPTPVASASPAPSPAPSASPTPTDDYTVPTPKPKLTKITLTRKRVGFTLSRKAKVTGTIKRRGKKVRTISATGKKGRTVRKVRKLRPGRYRVTLKPAGGTKKVKVVRIKRAR